MIERFTTFKGEAYTYLKYVSLREKILFSRVFKTVSSCGLFSAWDYLSICHVSRQAFFPDY